MARYDTAPDRSDMVRKSMRAPLLSREKEFELATAWRHQKDTAALNHLVSSYMRLVIAIAAKFRNYGLPINDLIQEGAVGLMQAAERFEPERDVRFSTYAAWWIRSAIQDFILRNWSIVRTGTTASQKALFFNLRRLRAKIEEEQGYPLGDQGRRQISDTLSVPLTEVENMEARLSKGDQSLNMTYGEASDDEWLHFLADERPTPEENVTSLHDTQRRSSWIGEALTVLDERERLIIEARRLQEEGATLEELGERLGVSKERVRQLEHRALGKLKKALLDRCPRASDLMQEG